MNIKKKIGERIRELRNEKKLSQEKLAFDSNIDRTYMSHLENGRKNVSVETLEKIIKSLDTDFSSFFKTIKK